MRKPIYLIFILILFACEKESELTNFLIYDDKKYELLIAKRTSFGTPQRWYPGFDLESQWMQFSSCLNAFDSGYINCDVISSLLTAIHFPKGFEFKNDTFKLYNSNILDLYINDSINYFLSSTMITLSLKSNSYYGFNDEVKSGNMIINKDDNIFNINFNFITRLDKNLTGQFTGEIPCNFD